MTASKHKSAVAYFRTSSATNVGDDKDSDKRQRIAVMDYAKSAGLVVVGEFYDAGVSGDMPVSDRPAFSALFQYITGSNTRIVLVENASRFARDVVVQRMGHMQLQKLGVDLVPVDCPTHFTQDTPSGAFIRDVLGSVAGFEKASLVLRLQEARKRKKAATGRCEGRPPVPDEVKHLAVVLSRKNRRTGRSRSLREITTELAAAGHLGPSGNPYGPESVKGMLAKPGAARSSQVHIASAPRGGRRPGQKRGHK